MKSLQAFSLSKLVLIITFISFVSCKKQSDSISNQSISKNTNAFYYREKVSTSIYERDLVDTIIGMCKKADSTAHFSSKIAIKYGYPQWDLAVTIGNSNGLKSLFIPVIDTGTQVQLLIFAYQVNPQQVIFKFVDRNTMQTQLPKANGDSRVFSKESLIGIFGALDKSVAASRVPRNSSMEQIQSNGTYISSLCWLISWHYEDGSVGVLNSQCTYQVIITPGVSATSGLPEAMIGVYEDIQAGDPGGGGDRDSFSKKEIKNEMTNPCLNVVLNEITDSKLKSLIATLFNSTFGTNGHNVNIKFI